MRGNEEEVEKVLKERKEMKRKEERIENRDGMGEGKRGMLRRGRKERK